MNFATSLCKQYTSNQGYFGQIYILRKIQRYFSSFTPLLFFLIFLALFFSKSKNTSPNRRILLQIDEFSSTKRRIFFYKATLIFYSEPILISTANRRSNAASLPKSTTPQLPLLLSTTSQADSSRLATYSKWLTHEIR